jgi:hypothetical protein
MIRPPMNAVEGHLWTLRPRRFAEGRERPMSKVNAGHMLSHFGVQHFGAPLIVSGEQAIGQTSADCSQVRRSMAPRQLGWGIARTDDKRAG